MSFQISGEGTHFLIPWVQKPIHFDIRSTPRQISAVTGSKGSFALVKSLFTFSFADLQNVQITLRILHRPDPAKLPSIYLNIGVDYAERVLPSITNEVLKAVVVRRCLVVSLKKVLGLSSGAVRRARDDHAA